PYAALLGLDVSEAAEPPYTLALLESNGRDDAAVAASRGSRWKREGNELHGDWIVGTGAGRTRAHVEVELRSLDALVQRGALVVLVDLAVVAALWTLAALGDGGVARWLRRRIRGWGRSYRARLTGVLFGFFIVPALAFVAWSYQRLQNDDRQSRELLVRETLRAAVGAADAPQLAAASERLETPLLLFGPRGEIRAASDTLLEALAPIGRFVHPGVYRDLVIGEEVTASRREAIGAGGTLFGYRAATGTRGERVVLAAPARADEVALDRRRRDLGVLVLFAAAIGALAALGLSGVAARELSRPIGALRSAAFAVARGEREPVPPGEPPAEFEPVFSAFRRMAADLSASKSALEEAQRRTAAVLRNVASGVVAVSGAGEVAIANPRAASLLGCDLAPGTPIDCFGSPEIESRLRAFIDAGDADEEEFDVEHGGRQLHARLTTVGWRGPVGSERPTVVLTVDDVTELARAQRVLAWGEMARQVAHEIKNPLTPIRLGVQHLRRARQNPKVDFDAVLEQNVGRILAEIDRLDEIARAFSRYGTAPAERPPSEPVDVAAVARDVIALEHLGHDGDGQRDVQRAGAGEARTTDGVSWVLEADDRPLVALAREDELREVLLNLLENSRLARARTVRVRVSPGRDGDDDGGARRVQIAVSDDGEGIAPEALPRVFEPHFSTRTSGSGLGLAISRRIIDGWGGSIGIESERGVGTTVTIELRAAG
ncbi:MAG TPA: ATP-binding protein, partial [Gemmatimonadaceae bacterium]|nr:ATP-binding protein [Gemmatimonadaceae bacterium]